MGCTTQNWCESCMSKKGCTKSNHPKDMIWKLMKVQVLAKGFCLLRVGP